MCGRVNVSDHPGVQQLLDFLDIPLYPQKISARYNIAPGAELLSVFAKDKLLKTKYMTWGIPPFWTKSKASSRPLINARSESIWEKPTFRNLIKTQRVVVPVNGFYEWQRQNNSKNAHHIHSGNDMALALAGIYQLSPEGIMQCCLITTEANKLMTEIHHRMPVILKPENCAEWLLSDNKITLNALMKPAPEPAITIDSVSAYVNNARNDGPQCLAQDKQMTLL